MVGYNLNMYSYNYLTILCGINGLYCIDLEFHLRISDKVSLLVLAGHSLQKMETCEM